MDWVHDLPTWPLHHLSTRLSVAPHRWHVQQAGSGPLVLLLHGAGSTTHTWRGLLPILAHSHRVVALDLPGQGFTQTGSRYRLGLAGMTADIAALCRAQDWRPEVLIGHSAGAALALNLADRMAAENGRPPRVIGLNAALGHFEGIAAWLFPLMAKVLAFNPLTAYAFTLGGRRQLRARRLIESTGSHLDETAIGYYARLLADRDHVDGTLQMMARWTIDPLLHRLDHIEADCLLLAADGDRAVAPKVSQDAASRLPNGAYVPITGSGHLAHEEATSAVADMILRWLSEDRSADCTNS